MIVGLDICPAARHFVEIDDAIAALDREAGRSRVVAINAHVADPPRDAVVLNFENVPGQVGDPAELWAGHEMWDFNEANAAKYGATFVPVGYHPSMERFKRAPNLDIDIVFSGCLNDRRALILEQLEDRGMNVAYIPPGTYGAERDAILARSKLALNMLFYPDGVFPALRCAHLVANLVPVLSEKCPEGWDFIPTTTYGGLVEMAEHIVRSHPASRSARAEFSYGRFKAKPMRLPA